MKTTIVTLTALAAFALAAQAASPTYKNASGSGTTNAAAYFRSDPSSQIRVVGAIATSDKAGSVLSFRTGTTPQTISATNTAGTAITVASTNGLATGDILVIETATGVTNATISSFPASTNITLNVSTGMTTLPGDAVYKMSAATTIKCGATSVTYQGEALYVGNRGRPISIILDGTSACSLDSMTARYQ